MKLNKHNKINLIPKDTYYCLKDFKLCPYWTTKKTDYGFKGMGKKIEVDYCKYLHKYLNVPDKVKDCDIGLPIEKKEVEDERK